jgi:methylmalonyl-CoA mutase N-terminal domain/subunit
MESPPVPIMKVDERVERDQVARLKGLKASRDNEKVTAALKDVLGAATGSANLMPPILTAVRAFATVGEIANVLRTVWGEHTETLVV